MADRLTSGSQVHVFVGFSCFTFSQSRFFAPTRIHYSLCNSLKSCSNTIFRNEVERGSFAGLCQIRLSKTGKIFSGSHVLNVLESVRVLKAVENDKVMTGDASPKPLVIIN